MNRLDELPRCEGCGVTLKRAPSPKGARSTLCADCRPKPPPKPDPPPQRSELELQRTRVMRAQGFSERQIADALDVNIRTIKARLRRARERGIATQKGAR